MRAAAEVRLAQLLGGISVVGDLSRGLGAGQGLRACAIAMRLAELVQCTPAERRAVYWVGFLRFVGCTATASEMAAALGDELAVSAAFSAADPRELREVLRGAVASVGTRPDRLLSFLVKAPGVVREHEVVSCEVGRAFAGELQLPELVGTALAQVFERWDGKGNPGLVRGDELVLPVRLWQVAHLAELFNDAGSRPDVAERLAARAGTQLDPDVVKTFLHHATPLLAAAGEADLESLLAAEPAPYRWVRGAELDKVLEIFGLVGDLKAPCFSGHSRRVAALAEGAAARLSMPDDQVQLVRRAALVQDVGRVAVSSRIWNQMERLNDADREQIRLHPYYSLRALSWVPALSDVAELATSHHERTDRSGYHRGLGHEELTEPALVLGAADRYVTAGEPRPHRAPLDEHARGELLLADAEAGRLPRRVVDAVLAAADPHTQRRVPPPTNPSPLTERECEVLREIAAGRTNVAAARRLGISPKTVNTHLEHAYAKLGVTTRTAAVVVATHRGWLEPSPHHRS